MTCVAAAAHHVFELACGGGLVFQPHIGMSGRRRFGDRCCRGGSPCQRVAPIGGTPLSRSRPEWGSAGATLHFTLWPWSVHRGVPLLDGAEGLRHNAMPIYNAIVWAWGLSAAGDPPRDAPRGSAGGVAWSGDGLQLTLKRPSPLRLGAEQARTDPARWNRALTQRPVRLSPPGRNPPTRPWGRTGRKCG